MTDQQRGMAAIADSPLSNGDLAPTTPERRTWGTYNLAALWIGLSIVITTYTLAAGLIAAGMTWWQGLLTVSLGNFLVLIPILLNSHAGTKYGIPFPVLVRSSFGIRGANVAAMARALVACGWFGIQTWIGALALDTLMTTLWSGWADVSGHKAIAFGVFWLVQVAIILRGIEGIKFLESYAAPLLLGSSVALLIWAFSAGGGIGNVFSASSKLIGDDQSFWVLFGPGLAANVGYWITLSMNIPDFTRYARDQRSQIVGQSIAMPLTMTGFSFIGIAVTAATVVVYGEAIWDPVTLVARLLDDLPVLLALAMVIVVIAQISTNMAANVVSPSFDFSNLSPRQISFRTGGLITAVHRDRLVPVEALRGRRRLHLHVARRLRQPARLVPRRDARSTTGCCGARGWTCPSSTSRASAARTGTRAATTGARSSPWRPASCPCCRASCTPRRRRAAWSPTPDFLDQLYRYGVFVAFGDLGGDLRGAVARRAAAARSPSRRWRADRGLRRDVPDRPAGEPGGRADRAGRAARLQPRVDVRLAHPVAGAVRRSTRRCSRRRSGSWSGRS